MKKLSREKGIFFVKGLVTFCVFLGLLFTLSCSDLSSGPSGKLFTVAVPSENEVYFGEKRDFYVVGNFEAGVPRIGDVRIELFRGDTASGVPIRVIESHVDDETGVTPESAIESDYPNGTGWKLFKAPDLVRDPVGFFYPGNKVLVTKTYFGGIILGGATKDFDTNYEDSSGASLEDLTEGVYTLRVTALSGDTILQSETLKLYFKPMFKLFGAFLPENHAEKFEAYAKDKGYRMFLDPFAGYFFPEGFDKGSYKINRRWRPQNSLEVVNTVEGVSYGTPENAQIGFILYNLVKDGVTCRLEIGKALLTDVVDSPNTLFFHYNIGEPEITYTTMESEEKTIDGAITPFDYGDRLVLARAEIKMIGTGDGDNKYNLYDETPKTLDLNLADGITMAASEEFCVFGVVTPIPTTVTESSEYLYYIADNRISSVRYRIKDAQGNEIAVTTRDVNLGRVYIKSKPDELFYSIFEFEHEFDFNAMNIIPGTYTVDLIALDKNKEEISGTAETFTVEYG